MVSRGYKQVKSCGYRLLLIKTSSLAFNLYYINYNCFHRRTGLEILGGGGGHEFARLAPLVREPLGGGVRGHAPQENFEK